MADDRCVSGDGQEHRVFEERKDQHEDRADAVRALAGPDPADGPAPVSEAGRDLSRGAVRDTAHHVEPVQPDPDTESVGRSSGLRQTGTRVSPEAAGHQQRNGRSGSDAERETGVLEAAVAVSEEPERRLSLLEHLCASTG